MRVTGQDKRLWLFPKGIQRDVNNDIPRIAMGVTMYWFAA